MIPFGAHEKFYGRVLRGSARISASSFNPAVFRTRDDRRRAAAGMRDSAMQRGRGLMRIRHRLKLDEANDFDLVDAGCRAAGVGTDQPGDVPGTRRHQLDRADGRRHRRDGDHDDFGHGATREIGVRKALGARRREILWQFLIEAAFLTSVGGLIGIICGSGIGLVVHWASGFPVSLPWWSFAIGIGFSASVGIFFGLFPAIKASRLDPIEALRYE